LDTVERLARRSSHPFADPSVFQKRRAAVSSAQAFLELYAEVCRLFRAPEDYLEAACDVSVDLGAGGVRYGEVYVSPEIFARIGLDPAACLEAVEHGFRVGTAAGGATCSILLDAVRHWGPESAERVLDLYERKPLPSILGFGMGGDENAVPAERFANVYLRARALGMKTSVHAGEWSGAESVREALDFLRPDRLDHGIGIAMDRKLLERLAGEGTILCVAPSGNVATGAVQSLAAHPLPRLLEAGVQVTLSADDPLLFSTTTLSEYRNVRRDLLIDGLELRRLAENAWRAAFCSSSTKEEGLAALARSSQAGFDQGSETIS
jgi:adenosine deaminase